MNEPKDSANRWIISARPSRCSWRTTTSARSTRRGASRQPIAITDEIVADKGYHIQEKPDMNWQPNTDERIIPISPMLRELLLQQYDHGRQSAELMLSAGTPSRPVPKRLRRAPRPVPAHSPTRARSRATPCHNAVTAGAIASRQVAAAYAAT
jgi:hypothetical protein